MEEFDRKKYTKDEKEMLVAQYNSSKLDINNFCNLNKLKKELFKNWLNNYIYNFTCLSIEDAMQNTYIIKENGEISCKIEINNYYIDEYNDNIVNVEIYYTNLEHYSKDEYRLFNSICFINQKYKVIYNLHIKDAEIYNKKFIPKITYYLTLVYEINDFNSNEYMFAIKNYDIYGDGIKKIKVTNTKNKEVSNIKCPSCNSSNIIKDGKRNEKQRYQCNECKRRFTEQ